MGEDPQEFPLRFQVAHVHDPLPTLDRVKFHVSQLNTSSLVDMSGEFICLVFGDVYGQYGVLKFLLFEVPSPLFSISPLHL